MGKLLHSGRRLSSLLMFFTIVLLLNACRLQSSTSTISRTPQPTLNASATVGTPRLTQSYTFTAQDSGKTATYTVTSRFTIILTSQQYPKENFQVTCNPAGAIGSISNLPSVTPPFYAIRYEGVQPGMCTIKNGSFRLTVNIVA